MNLTEVSQLLVREGPVALVAAVVGLMLGALVGWKCAKRARKRDAEADPPTDQLRTQVGDLASEVEECNRKIAACQSQTLGEVEKRTQERLAPLISSLDRLEKEVAAQGDVRRQLAEAHAKEIERLKRLAVYFQTERNQARQQGGDAQALVRRLEGELERANANLRGQTQRAKDAEAALALGQGRPATVPKQIETPEQTAEVLEGKYEKSEAESEQATAKLAGATEALDVERARADKAEAKLRALAEGGKIWARPVPPEAPRFVPLGRERECPIISLLNLKGGVGKTTLTLNLAATLSDRGKRVLMIDCDHQRSLSLFCVPQQRLPELHRSRATLQGLMRNAKDATETLLPCIQDLTRSMPRCSIVVNTSAPDGGGLTEVEERMMLDWLASPDSQDARLALRAVLHRPEIARKFDYVLLDCPPRFSTAAINALAASDFVLVPVILDVVSAINPLPNLLRELHRLNEPGLFPQFDLLGIVANRVHFHGGKVTGNQPTIWADLDTISRGAWRKPVHQFDTMISDELVYGRTARVLHHDTEHAVAVWSDSTPRPRDQFSKLTTEILGRITDASVHVEPVHS
jgi:cellulose biosynthesis protein BcsQ